VRLLIKGGRLINPASGFDGVTDVLIEDGIVAAVKTKIDTAGTEVIDADGKWVIPGVVDIHAHISEPTRYDRETVRSFCEAAVCGGITTALCRPSEDIYLDDVADIEFLLSRNRKVGKITLLPVAALTRKFRGENITEFGDLAEAGAVALSDDRHTVRSSRLMRYAMEYARDHKLPVITFPQDPDLAGDGSMNEGPLSTLLGLRGIPYSAEDVVVVRDIILARMTGARVHISPVTTAGSVDLVRRAKADGIPVTCDTSPHYFLLTEKAVEGYNTNAKVNPPLRRERDMAAVRQGLADGAVDVVVASAHRPLSTVDKDVEFAAAQFGMSGIETLLPLSLDSLCLKGKMKPLEAVALLTTKPAKIMGMDTGAITVGAPGDVTVVDVENERKIEADALRSKGKNTAFEGIVAKGFAWATISGGRLVMIDGEPVG
jgi:dihydroorotase